jgi:EAL domain-containing protein (putative c-di-GMP-specific phosphodiesterase class I)
MGARVLAEGIETEEQLREIADDVRGYYYAKPMSSTDFLSRIGIKSC